MLKHYIALFFGRELWQRIKYFFTTPPISKVLSPSDCIRAVTLLLRSSIHLNKSLTRLKSDLCWNTIEQVFERKIWQRIDYFFCIPPRSKILSPSDCTRAVTLLPRPSTHLNNSLTRLKAIYVETLYSAFLSAKFDNVSSTFLYTT